MSPLRVPLLSSRGIAVSGWLLVALLILWTCFPLPLVPPNPSGEPTTANEIMNPALAPRYVLGPGDALVDVDPYWAGVALPLFLVVVLPVLVGLTALAFTDGSSVLRNGGALILYAGGAAAWFGGLVLTFRLHEDRYGLPMPWAFLPVFVAAALLWPIGHFSRRRSVVAVALVLLLAWIVRMAAFLP